MYIPQKSSSPSIEPQTGIVDTQMSLLGLGLKKETMERFRSEPEWGKPIDRYFKRQQECQTVMEDSNVPIKDPIMVDQMVQHFAERGIIKNSRQKWERYLHDNLGENIWEDSKKWHREN